MPKLIYSPCPHYVELEFTDGKIRRLQGSPSEMRLYFVDYVMDAVNIYNSFDCYSNYVLLSAYSH